MHKRKALRALRTGSLCRKTMNGGAMEPITDPIADHRSVWKALPLVMGGQSARRRSLRSLLVDQQRCAACGSWGVARTVERDLGGAAPMRQYSGGGAQSRRIAMGRGCCGARSDSGGVRGLRILREAHRVIHTPRSYFEVGQRS